MTQYTPEPPEPLAQTFQADVYEAFADMPSLQAAMAQGGTGAQVDASNEEFAAALQRMLFVLLDHTGRLAEEVDRLREQIRPAPESGG